MARQISIPSLVYTPQTLVRSVDTFPANVSKLVFSLTREAWPLTPNDIVAILSIVWDSGGGIEVSLPGGVISDRNGVLAASVITLDVPQVPAGPKRVDGGTATLQILQTLRTAITIAAS